MLSAQITLQFGFVMDIGPEVRPGFEIVADTRAVVMAPGMDTGAFGAVVRGGWRSHAGASIGVVARGGYTRASGCAGQSHIVDVGVEAEVGGEFTSLLPPTLLAGADVTIGSLWFGFQGNTHADLRVTNHRIDGVQVGHDAGAVLFYPACGWELE